MPSLENKVLRQVEEAREEMAQFAADLVKIPSVNPPGENYRECAELIGSRLKAFDFELNYYQVEADDLTEYSSNFPRINVMGRKRGRRERPSLHLNGHFDVVPPGRGWTFDPFAGKIENGRIYGRGSADMKAGMAAAIYAAEAIRRAGIELGGALQISGTVDEESGGFAGAGWLCRQGVVCSKNTDYVIIPEPFGSSRVCLGHRGVYWFKVIALGKTAHGSMPFLGKNAIESMGNFLESLRKDLMPELRKRKTAMPVVPPEARTPTLNINSISGGQAGANGQTPCVADRCEAVFDRRFLPEENFEEVRNEIRKLLEKAREKDSSAQWKLEDILRVSPVSTPTDSRLVMALDSAARKVLGHGLQKVASPGTYDQKHFHHLGRIEQCAAYGPGNLEQAHQPDEFCSVDDLVTSAKVLALAIIDLTASIS